MGYTSNQKKNSMHIETWYVRTMSGLGKLHLLIEELDNITMQITCLYGTRWDEEGNWHHGKHTIIYCGSSTARSGVAFIVSGTLKNTIISCRAISDMIISVKTNTKTVATTFVQINAPSSTHSEEEINDFYDQLQSLLERIPCREAVIIFGDFKAKVGECAGKKHEIGLYGLGTHNASCGKLADVCQVIELVVTNTCVQYPKRQRYTWISPQGNTRNKIDYILVRKSWFTVSWKQKRGQGLIVILTTY